MDTIWDEMDAMARIREAKRRKRADARRKLAQAMERAKMHTQTTSPMPNSAIMPRKRVKVRELVSEDGRELRLRAIEGQVSEIIIAGKQKTITTRISLPFNSFIHEEDI